MQSNREPALLGVSELRLRVTGSTIAATAKLGAIANLRAFILLFPPSLCLGLALLFTLLKMPVNWDLSVLLVPWLVIGPWLASSLERRTIRAVDRLVRGMATR